MSDYPDWFAEHVRRKTLAELRIAKEISKQDSSVHDNDHNNAPSEKELHERFQYAQDLKPSFGMMFFSGMLTLTSVVLVSLCFITTINSYDMALSDTDRQGMPNVVTFVQRGGPLNAMAEGQMGGRLGGPMGGPLNPFVNRMQPRFANAFHFNRQPRFARVFR